MRLVNISMYTYVHRMSKKRPYTLRKRAKSQEETRQKIVEAAMQLHETLGPRETTISAIAEKAGVQRLTVYRHFPDDAAIFQACTAHWLDLNPPPDPARWQALSGEAAIETALAAWYAYFRGTGTMWDATYRDAASTPAIQEPFKAFRTHMRDTGDALAAQYGATAPDSPVARTIRHVLGFPVWQEFAGEGMADEEIVRLALAWIRGAG